MPLQRPSLILLGDDRAKALARIGFRNLRDLLDYEPLQSARTLAAISQGLISKPSLEPFVKEEYVPKDAVEAISWPVTALHLTDAQAQALSEIGVKSIGDLAQLGKEAGEAVLVALEDNGFRERPSAPAQLLPGMTGSVASSVRFTTFIRDVELRKLTFKVHEDCLIPLPISSPYTKYPGSLAEIFEAQKCPVVHLGYMCDHRQRWINLGTHLGEVVHSLSLAPGESRNIALVNWHRRQLTALEEQTRTREDLSATFVQNRALEEITSAVAREHQSGGTQTEANTFATAVGVVGAIGVSAGIGAAIGTAITPGVGTAIGAVAGGIAGAIAGGAVFSGSQTLGMIEADTEGNREIVAEVQQRIALSTSQTASAVRSLWSTVVVEDVQAESVEATTSNITNYNHMHALNIEYYEVLQHYLVRIEVERVQPILFLPFTFFDFTGFRFVRDYWEAVRPYIDDEGLQVQGDSYFVTEEEPESPDPLPVPPVPSPPGDPEPLILRRLVIDVLFNSSVPTKTAFNLTLLRGNQEVRGVESENGVPSGRLDGYDYGNRYRFGEEIEDAQEITGVSLSRNNNELLGGPENTRFHIRVSNGFLRNTSRQLSVLSGDVIRSNAIMAADAPMTLTIPWSPAADFETDNAIEVEEYNRALRERAIIVAKNKSRQAAFESLVENRQRFELRLQKLILRRRHFFTRVLLTAIEPEEIIQLLEALRIGHTDVNSDFGIPLSDIAHTIPLGMTTGAFVLKLKRLDQEKIVKLAQRLGIDQEIEELMTLLQYSDQTLTFFEDAKSQGVLVQTDHVYAPTGGLFAEAILGRANSAEYLDMERYFNWQDSPIPHQPPAISAVSTDSRFQQGNVSVNVPEGNLQVINPVSLPDPTGLQGVLTAIQNPNLFRDMSNASTLAGIIGSLSTLAGQMGQAASTMTGQAAQQALQAATEASNAAAGMAQSIMSQASTQTGGAFNTPTSQGAALNQAAKIDGVDASGASGTTIPTNPGTSGGQPSTSRVPSLQEETFRRMAGLNGTTFTSSTGTSFPAPDLTVPGDQVSPFLWRDLIEFKIPQDILDMLASRNMSSLSLAAASSAHINLDYFPIRVTKLPTVDGQQLTADQFLDFIRRNLHTNLFIPTTLSQFQTYAQEDNQIWFSSNPYRAVLKIDLLGPDNAAVVIVESTNDHWIFHTIATPDTGDHPVSGQRMFGYWNSAPNEFTFYTRGADRATGVFPSLVSEQLFEGGGALWATFQADIAGFVNSNSGEAFVPRAFAGRFSWFNLIGALRAATANTI